MKAKILSAALFFLTISFFANAQPQIELQSYQSGFDQPIGIVNAGDDRLFVVEQRGLIKIIDGNGDVLETPFLDLSDKVSQSGSERGLLGLAFHPDYPENGYFFINYTLNTDGNTVVARFKVDENNSNVAVESSEQQLLAVDQPYANHNGGQLLFGPDGYLYIALGDGGSSGDPQNNAQNLNSYLGKMLRIDVGTGEEAAYSIPADNPFADNDNALDEIWARGLRNPWRNSFDRLTGDFWIADVGQNSREEVNFQGAGSDGGINYGWRCYEGNLAYNTDNCPGEENFVFPVYDYAHAVSGCTGSVTGGYVYRGVMHNELFGKYLFADFCTGNLYYISQTDDGFDGTLLGKYDELEYTAFGEDQYGELYIALRGSGEIRKVVETSDCKPVAVIKNADSALVINGETSLVLEAVFNPSLNYQWNKNGVSIEGETDAQLSLLTEGTYSLSVTNPENGCSNTSAAIEVVATSIPEAKNANAKILVFPNPASHRVSIKGLPADKTLRIRLVNETGTVVYEKKRYNGQDIQIPTRNFSSGLYILQVNYDSTEFHKKVVVQ